MKKAMISQLITEKTDEEIIATRIRAIQTLETKGYEVVNPIFTDDIPSRAMVIGRDVVQPKLCFLAKSLENMSLCHAVYFYKGWKSARECRIEHDIAVAYGLEVIYEEEK